MFYLLLKEDNQFAQIHTAHVSRRLAEGKMVSISVDRHKEEALREQSRNRETHRDVTKRLRWTDRESLAWVWMGSGLKSRGYLCVRYKFACS